MEATEALALDYYPLVSELWSLTGLRGILSGTKAGISHSEFTSDPTVLYVRRDNGDRNTVVNVFLASGEKAFTIERLSRLSTVWTIYRADRSQVAKLSVGLFNREVHFIGKPQVRYRRIGRTRWLYSGLPDRKFYLNDGAPYAWTHNSRYLERIVNPGGGHEEARQRLARVQLLRPYKFDWELAVDKSLDQDVALATAFISMLTQWSTFATGVAGVRTVGVTPKQATTSRTGNHT